MNFPALSRKAAFTDS